MPLDFADAIRSVGEAFQSLFNYFSVAKENQSETQIIKDKKRLKQATNIAQNIFDITDKYQFYFSKRDFKEYQNLKEKFNKKD